MSAGPKSCCRATTREVEVADRRVVKIVEARMVIVIIVVGKGV